MRAEGRRWGNEASVPDEAWEGLGTLGEGADFLEREGEFGTGPHAPTGQLSRLCCPSSCHRGGPYVRFAYIDRPTVTESLRAGLLGHTPVLPVTGRAQRGHSEPWGEAMPWDGPPPPTASRPTSHLTWIHPAEASSMASWPPLSTLLFFCGGRGQSF